ncbi:type VI secretion system tube protein Hcp [Aeoliella sp. ICT_H6.2]|uniref:Type VI secretion system tube protein Hcp n=1 Tax=Aeoliella straminimaris TaxID=2954799 RepID=A0A9X2F760_9BACT|nr:type VI secretion system tube protein Hcp [Aeoliella straminimaris]MCO6043535.1 type VI secretion system tube protein Hcp [Aeoliella straminimaris]
MHKAAVAILLGTLLGMTSCQLVQAAGYIKFDGVDGESTDAAHQGWSDLSRFQFDILRPFDNGRLGRESLSTKFSMPTDSAYPFLTNALMLARSFDSVQVELWDDDQLMTSYEYENALTPQLSVTYSGGAPGQLNGTLVSESLTLSHYTYDSRDGSLLDVVTFEYDFSFPAGAVSAGPLPGDYNGDGTVDQSDYGQWKSQFGTIPVPIGSGADGNADGLVDLADYNVWRNHLGSTTTPSMAATEAVPEPTPLALAILGIVGVALVSRHRTEPLA